MRGTKQDFGPGLSSLIAAARGSVALDTPTTTIYKDAGGLGFWVVLP